MKIIVFATLFLYVLYVHFTKRCIFIQRKRIFIVLKNNVIFNRISVFGLKKRLLCSYMIVTKNFTISLTQNIRLLTTKIVSNSSWERNIHQSLLDSLLTPSIEKSIKFHKKKKKKHKHTYVCVYIISQYVHIHIFLYFKQTLKRTKS